jgi:hypothetical protein
VSQRVLSEILRSGTDCRSPPVDVGGGLFLELAFGGIVHDAVISLPAGGGYGGPSVFFILQALGMLAERSRFGKSIGPGSG